MIERFEDGKWYRYTGEGMHGGEKPVGIADFMLDGKPHFCEYASGRCVADGFEEVFMPEKGDTIMVRDYDSQSWVRRIFLHHDNSFKHGSKDVPYVCVCGDDEEKFVNGKEYRPEHWCQAKPFEKPEVKPEPKRGDKVLVWGDGEKEERIYLDTIEGSREPYIVVANGNEYEFRSGKSFGISSWAHISPLPDPVKKPYHPYTDAELNDLVGAVFTNKRTKRRIMATKKPLTENCIHLDGSAVSATQLLDSYVHESGTPCGIRED